MERIRLNLNMTVEVTLTGEGMSVILEKFREINEFNEKIGVKPLKECPGLKGNKFKSSLWEIMKLFGQGMYMGNPSPPVLNELIVEVGEEWKKWMLGEE